MVQSQRITSHVIRRRNLNRRTESQTWIKVSAHPSTDHDTVSRAMGGSRHCRHSSSEGGRQVSREGQDQGRPAGRQRTNSRLDDTRELSSSPCQSEHAVIPGIACSSPQHNVPHVNLSLSPHWSQRLRDMPENVRRRHRPYLCEYTGEVAAEHKPTRQ